MIDAASILKRRNMSPNGKLKLRKLAKLLLVEPLSLVERDQLKNAMVDCKQQDVVFRQDGFKQMDEFPLVQMGSTTETFFSHFPCLIQPDGTPWALGNIYLLELATEYPVAESSTLEKISAALADFNDVISELGLDFFDFPLRKAKRPTYAYSDFHRDVVKENPKKGRSSNEKILKIIAFYRWLQHYRGLNPLHPMWKETVEYVRVKNKHGVYFDKQIIRTDLAIKVVKSLEGRALRSYDEAEQNSLVVALLKLDNTEMSLGFLLALTTGARLQTVFTMQASALENYEGAEYHPVTVGEGENADTKYQKRFFILIPGWLIQALKTYLGSSRYLLRKSNSKYREDPMSYIFLTTHGAPYYVKKNDRFAGDYRTLPRGNSVHAFIRQQLNCVIADLGVPFKVRFHNLRATFGSNLVAENMERLNSGEITWHDLLQNVSERLAHASLDETENYVNNARKKKMMVIAQKKFEAHLESQINQVLGEGNDV